ncbi:MAG: hypothetical protein JWP87_1804 [Labilithrix sp.]|nr:hypothetical protein [Labilithrix sp.]
MTTVLARIPALRLVRTPRAWLPIAAWAVLALAIALAARSRGSTTGADHVMRGAFAFLVLPLVSYGVVGATLGAGGLRRGIRGVVALGATPRSAALASVLVAIATSAALCGLLGAIVCALAHGSGDPPLGSDLPASLWISALGGAAYAAYFSVGSAIGKGTMRGVFLAFDWIIGGGAGVGALVTPRGHVTSLLGGPACAELSQRASSMLLVVLVVVYASLAVVLVRRV